MRFDVLTLFPEMFQGPLGSGVVGQAVKSGLVEIGYQNPREYTENVHKTVDDRPYGGGDGMVMLPGPLEKALEAVRVSDTTRVIYMSPQGTPLNHDLAKELSGLEHVVLICGRYGGVDQRFIAKHVDQEISVGDYVVSGGELPAMIVIDAVSRFIPGVLGNTDSPENESFADGLLEAPLFTRPKEYDGLEVPGVLTSGHHANVERWRQLVSILRTKAVRPHLLDRMMIPRKDWEDAERLFASMTPDERLACGLESGDEGP